MAMETDLMTAIISNSLDNLSSGAICSTMLSSIVYAGRCCRTVNSVRFASNPVCGRNIAGFLSFPERDNAFAYRSHV
jgi:hypothetical protein